MSSFTQMASNALQQLGAAPISDIAENTGRAKRVNAIYQDVRDAVIRDASWNFATVRVQLAALADAPAFTWAKQHQMPENPYCLRVLDVYSGDERIDHVVEGRKILSDYATINLLYLKRVVDSSLFDPMFIEAYESRLAAELAIPITGSRGISEDFWGMYDRKIANARLVNSQEGTPAAIQANSLVDVRRRTFVVDDQKIKVE